MTFLRSAEAELRRSEAGVTLRNTGTGGDVGRGCQEGQTPQRGQATSGEAAGRPRLSGRRNHSFSCGNL